MEGLTVERAQIAHAQVTIQTLRVGKKQVTQSVFRQLEPRTLLDRETGELHGVLWGRVNHYWGQHKDKDRNPLEHPHVVWRSGDKLYRDLIPKRGWGLPRLVEDVLRLVGQQLHSCDYAALRDKLRAEVSDALVKAEGERSEPHAALYRKAREYVLGFQRSPEREHERVAEARNEAQSVFEAIAEPLRQRYTENFNVILEAPHLFIAV